MKIVTVLILSILLMLSTTGKGSGKGISFVDGSVTDAMEIAKKENKPVFIYVYASWCAQCKKLKKSFKDKEAGEYFNKKFINVALDGETGEGKMLLNNYDIKVYPTLLIIDANGKQLTKTTGYHTPYLLVNFGRRIVAK